MDLCNFRHSKIVQAPRGFLCIYGQSQMLLSLLFFLILVGGTFVKNLTVIFLSAEGALIHFDVSFERKADPRNKLYTLKI